MGALSSGKLEFSPEHKRLLKDVRITASGPGTILRDFNMLLGFLGERGFPLTGTHQLPLRALPEINARMACPLQHGLKRPQQKSYPHINGLYLLARASGITFVGGANKQPILFVDKEVLHGWRVLNPTEQYFSLLETWLLRANPEIIQELGRRSWPIPEHFREWVDLFRRIPDEGLRVEGDGDAEEALRFRPGWYNLGLLELFGLISVRCGSPAEGKGWNIKLIRRKALGDALSALLLTECSGYLTHILEPEYGNKIPSGVLQPIFRPYFPKWKNHLSIPKWVFKKGAHVFKVSLGRVWFRIAMPADQVLDELASAILDAVGFQHDHLYRFSYESRLGTMDRIYHPEMFDQSVPGTERPWTNEVLVGDLPLQLGQTMVFLFDFGDKWEFDVTLERIDPDRVAKKPVLLEMHGEPPEQYSRWGE